MSYKPERSIDEWEPAEPVVVESDRRPEADEEYQDIISPADYTREQEQTRLQ